MSTNIEKDFVHLYDYTLTTVTMLRLQRCLMAFIIALLCASGSVWAQQGTMTDEQVLEYVKQGVSSGKNRDELVKELLIRGVTREQAQRVYQLYQNRQNGKDDTALQREQSRAHTLNGEETKDPYQDMSTNENVRQNLLGQQDSIVVYGRNLFRTKELDFAPSENLATPRNYRLGPGDEVIIDVFGRNQTTLRSIISPEGSINVDILGPVYLSGMTIEEANKYLKKRLSQIYSGLGKGSGTDMRLSLGQIRTIQITVVGDVPYPGTYLLSAFSSAFHALYKAGGVVDPGTLRDIKVIRDDKVVAKVDVYDFLQNGSLSNDVRLNEGDVIVVGPYKSLVQVEGGVKRPMYFEMKDGETLSQLLDYAGGFANGANTTAVTIHRQSQKNYEVRTVEDKDFASFVMQNGDRVEIGELPELYENRVVIHGAVYFPGTFELSSARTAKLLVQMAGGLLPEAFSDRVVVHREHQDKSQEVFSLNLSDIMAGISPDFVLENNDEIYIASAYDLKEQGTMVIDGMVTNPGTYPFAANTTIEDFIIMAGGLLDGASTSRVDVTRRKKDANGMVALNDIGEMYSFSLENGLIFSGDRSFVLEPYDEVMVHKSPSFNIQRHFTVSGEVNFPAVYSLTSRQERVSDLINKAGGLTEFAYTKGAHLTRIATPEEIEMAKRMVEVVERQIDTTDTEAQKAVVESYLVSIDLDKALANPGGDEDVILREGDILDIPSVNNVVRIHGAVRFPTAVNYEKKMRGRDYIEAAGGFANDALRSKGYVVDMSGRARRYTCGMKVEPGSEIYIPEKIRKEREFNPTVLLAIAQSAASMGTLAVAVYSIVRSASSK